MGQDESDSRRRRIYGRRVSARLECEQLSPTAFRTLTLMIRYFSKVKNKVEDVRIFQERRGAVATGRAVVPALPRTIPFAVEYPEDLKRFVRVEIEFRNPLTPGERDAIFGALSVWDQLIEALADKEWWGQQQIRKSE